MTRELADIIITMMNMSDYQDDKIIKGITSLTKEWPSLTDQEVKEIKAVVNAFSIITGYQQVEPETDEQIKEIRNGK